MPRGLTCIGYVWSLLSLTATAAVCTGYYLPFWLNGSLLAPNEKFKIYSASFGCFRRCTYWSKGGMREGCGRYTEFTEIPSIWWQVCTVTVGVGCALSALIAFISVPACCTMDIVSRTSGRILGIFQVISAVLICVGCVLYPLGWDNREAKEACGDKIGPYLLGSCTIGWAYYLILGGACLLFICASLSTIAGHPIHWRRLKYTGDFVDQPVNV